MVGRDSEGQSGDTDSEAGIGGTFSFALSFWRMLGPGVGSAAAFPEGEEGLDICGIDATILVEI